MSEPSESAAPATETSAVDAVTQFTNANRNAMDLIFGAQKAIFEEMVFAGNEVLERTRTELHLFNELISKVAGAHSAKDVKVLCEECGQHQIDFVRRDSERLFRHGERLVETASNLLAKRQQN